MSDRRFWLTPRWLVGHLVAAALVTLFVVLGVWQLQRHQQRAVRNAAIEARLDAPAAPLATLLERFDAEAEPSDPMALAYRRTVASGRWDADAEVLLRNRSYQGQAGWHLLTPLLLDAGGAVLVERGWVPLELDTPPVAAALPPDGPVTVVGVALPEADPPTRGFAARFGPRDPPPAEQGGRLERAYWADVERLAADLPYRLEPLVLRLVAQEPPQSGELPRPVALPDRTRGPHLGYALQWFAFALIGVVGYAFLMRQQAREASRGAG